MHILFARTTLVCSCLHELYLCILVARACVTYFVCFIGVHSGLPYTRIIHSKPNTLVCTVPLKGNVALAHIFFSSELVYSSEQRVEEMVSQANARLELLAQSSFLHTVVSSRCCESCCEYSSENSILYHTASAERFHRGEAFDSWYCNLCWVVNITRTTSTKRERLNE